MIRKNIDHPSPFEENMVERFFREAEFRENDRTAIAECFKKKSLHKDALFVEAGKKSTVLGLIESGLFQYFVLADGDERTTYVATEGTFVVSLYSFLNDTPSQEYIRALTDASVWCIGKTDVRRLIKEIPAFKDFYIGLLEWQIGCIEKSRHELITMNAEERYSALLRNEPILVQRIPLQYLASILGVTPRHLSRIRKNIR